MEESLKAESKIPTRINSGFVLIMAVSPGVIYGFFARRKSIKVSKLLSVITIEQFRAKSCTL
jgi:hypothetical protein